jgi:hypothetical protein
MRRLTLLALFCVVLGLFSCHYDNGQIINYSSYSVSGETRKGMNFNLSPGQSKDHEYTDDTIKNFSATPARVSYRYSGDNTEFYDNPAIDLSVINTLSYPVELSAQGLIEYEESSVIVPEPIPITAGPTTIIPTAGDTLQIFSLKPTFTAYAIDGGIKYPATVDYAYDPSGIITVTIH